MRFVKSQQAAHLNVLEDSMLGLPMFVSQVWPKICLKSLFLETGLAVLGYILF